ncbi:MAG: hypothetical protein EBY97_05860, partial [Burkholderiaceae bacterium]|nr:hypothetical protein [Burkholderiaceae bacterium]
MRRLLLLIGSAAILVLSGCASTSPEWSSSSADTRRDPRAAKAPRVDLSKQSVSNLMAPSNDLWVQIRQGFQLPELDSPLVEKQTQWLVNRPDYVNRSMARSSRYLFYIVEEVNRRNMPTEIALLPFVESAFNPEAKSTAKAMGIWQFMPRTGQDFKLTQNVFRDERRDVLQSTNAALDYLQRLYKQFGDWQLALAAYNWGEGNVARAIKRNQALRKPTDYESLTMPRETPAIGPSAPVISTSPALSGAPLRTMVCASHKAAISGLPRQATPAPTEIWSPRRSITMPHRRRSRPSSLRGSLPSTNRPEEALSAMVSVILMF